MRQGVTALIGLALVAGCAGQPASQQPTEFRMYRANDRLQLDRIPALNEDEPGCHDMLLTLRVYRVAQIGFEYCTAYSEKNCREGSEIPVSWKNEEAPVTRITQGDRWFLVSDHRRGADMGSWYCAARE